ncbi:hypothetical protein NQ318_006898 [Aromia moschata]|uniref:Uncharacterized protein n=1 Tax=Aromia moschata TaxID=1265417 RepID=A0AAV8YLF9_9CUCU|nr:hypothetical protein NQ318_006898 [Aromia moschata]
MYSLNVVENQNLTTFLQRVIDLEEADKETMHLLVRPGLPAEEKNLAKTQGIVLRHLYLLLGYSQNDRGLYFTSSKVGVRLLSVFFFRNLTVVNGPVSFDGPSLVTNLLNLLQYATSPYLYRMLWNFNSPHTV